MGLMKRLVFAAIAVSLTTLAGTAGAQAWLKDRAVSRGKGLKTGDVEFHPGIAAELGYDSNYFNRSSSLVTTLGPSYRVVDTVRLRITPQFYVNTASRGEGSTPPKMLFSIGGAFIYSEFLMNTDLLGRNREYGAVGEVMLNVLPGRPVGLNLFDTFTRTAQPSLDIEPTAGLNRIENRVGAEIVYTKPGGMLDWRWGYAFNFTYFETGAATALNNYRHEIYTRGRYRFLPRTSLIYDGSIGFQNYVTPTGGLSNSRPIRTRIGVSGLLTYRFGLLALVGWGSTFYENAGIGVRDADTIIGQVEGRYYFNGAEAGEAATGPVSSISVGFIRDFQNSYIGNFYERNRGYVSSTAVFGQRFFLTVQGGVAQIRYGDVLGRQSGTLLARSFTSTRLDASIFTEYRITDWFGINASFQYLAEITDTRIPLSSTANAGAFSIGFNRIQLFGGIRIVY